jgi:hypothetical protein
LDYVNDGIQAAFSSKESQSTESPAGSKTCRTAVVQE